MTTTTQKKRKSWFIWLIIFGLIALLVSLTILYFVGYDYVSWIGAYIVGEKMWAATNWITGFVDIVVFITIGAIGYWFIKAYFIGDKTKTLIPNYTPQTGASATTNPGTTTEIG